MLWRIDLSVGLLLRHEKRRDTACNKLECYQSAPISTSLASINNEHCPTPLKVCCKLNFVFTCDNRFFCHPNFHTHKLYRKS